MFSKNLKYYRLKAGYNKKQLAELVNITPASITHYENGDRVPTDMMIINKLAEVLQISPLDFLKPWNPQLQLSSGLYRKNSKLSKMEQNKIESEVEDYFQRLFEAIEIVGGEPLPDLPDLGKLEVDIQNPEKMAAALRKALHFPEVGPITNLAAQLENRGILIVQLSNQNDNFSGLNGKIGEYPFIAYNFDHSAQRSRSDIAHELVHLMFDWSGIDNQVEEKLATAVGAAFLLPGKDLKREIGIKRGKIGSDMLLVSKEYQVSFQLTIRRAAAVNIIGDQTYKAFFMNLNKKGKRRDDFYTLEKEPSHFMEQLVLRAYSENGISLSKASQLLGRDVFHIAEIVELGEIIH